MTTINGETIEKRSLNFDDIPLIEPYLTSETNEFLQDAEDLLKNSDISVLAQTIKELCAVVVEHPDVEREVLFTQLCKIGKKVGITKPAFNKAYDEALEEKANKDSQLQTIDEHFNGKKQEPTYKINDNCYYFQNGNNQYQRVSNFVIENPYLIEAREPVRILNLANRDGVKIYCPITSREFSSEAEFKAKIEGLGNFVWMGTSKHLSIIKEDLFKNTSSATQFDYLGYHDEHEVYAFCNYIVDIHGKVFQVNENGFARVGEKSFYIPYNTIQSKQDRSVENFRNFKHFEESKITFETWSKLFIKVYGDNGVIGLSFYLAALFRDIIFRELKCFPHLFLYGMVQSGKSTFSDSIQSLWGIKQTPINLEAGSTQVGSFRKMEHYSNAVIAINEYKNTIDPKLIGMLKAAFDGQGRETGVKSNDNRTKTSVVSSALEIAGQDLPSNDPALFSRVIILSFQPKKYSTVEKDNYNLLESYQRAGLTSVTVELLKYRIEIDREFASVFIKVYRQMKNKKSSHENMERSLVNYAMLITMVEILRKFIAFPTEFDSFENLISDNLSRYSKLLENTTDVNNFWTKVELFISQGYLKEGADYRRVLEGGETILYIRYHKLYDLYAKHGIQTRTTVINSTTMLDYLKNSPAYHGQTKKKFNDQSCNVYGFVENMVINYEPPGRSEVVTEDNDVQGEACNWENVESDSKLPF